MIKVICTNGTVKEFGKSYLKTANGIIEGLKDGNAMILVKLEQGTLDKLYIDGELKIDRKDYVRGANHDIR